MLPLSLSLCLSANLTYRVSVPDNGSATKHPDSYHAGRPPTKGEKWAFNLWFHEGPTQAGYAATQSKLYAEGKAGPSIRDLMSHVAKKSQERQEKEQESGSKLPQREPTEEEKQLLQEKLERFFADNTPTQFKRKQAPEPRSSTPDPTGFEAVQAAIREIAEKQKDADNGASADLEPQPEPLAGQSAANTQEKLSRRQRAAAAKKLKAANEHEKRQLNGDSASAEGAAVHAAGATVAGNETPSREMAELHALQQAVQDAQARLDAFVQAHPGLSIVTETDKTHEAAIQTHEADSKEQAASGDSICAASGQEKETRATSEKLAGAGEMAAAAGPMARLIDAATQQLERQQQEQRQQERGAERGTAKGKTSKEKAPPRKRQLTADTKEDVLKALKQMQKERETDGGAAI